MNCQPTWNPALLASPFPQAFVLALGTCCLGAPLAGHRADGGPDGALSHRPVSLSEPSASSTQSVIDACLGTLM